MGLVKFKIVHSVTQTLGFMFEIVDLGLFNVKMGSFVNKFTFCSLNLGGIQKRIGNWIRILKGFRSQMI